MDDEIEQSASGTRITVSGRLTFAEYGRIRRILRVIARDGSDGVVLDLGGLTFIDSAGIEMLLVLRDAVRQRQGRIHLGAAADALEAVMAADVFQPVLPPGRYSLASSTRLRPVSLAR